MSNAPRKERRRIIFAPVINHVSSHMIPLQLLPLNISEQDLILNHSMLATSEIETVLEL